MFGLDEQASS